MSSRFLGGGTLRATEIKSGAHKVSVIDRKGNGGCVPASMTVTGLYDTFADAVAAIDQAHNKPVDGYPTVWDKMRRSKSKRSAIHGSYSEAFEPLLAELGCRRIDPNLHDPEAFSRRTRMTVNRFMSRHGAGRWLVETEQHFCAVIDGELFDTANPTGRRRVVSAWEVVMREPEPVAEVDDGERDVAADLLNGDTWRWG